MVEHDLHVGELLDLLDELGIADNTVVMYSTDNGAIIILGQMLEPHHSMVKKTAPGKVLIVFLHLLDGQVIFQKV